jgi:hypothetical protein
MEAFSLKAEGLLTKALFLRRADSQCRGKALVSGSETTMNFLNIRQLGSVDLIQRSLDGLNLQHTIGNDFTF